jgi:hypothetical protein
MLFSEKRLSRYPLPRSMRSSVFISLNLLRDVTHATEIFLLSPALPARRSSREGGTFLQRISDSAQGSRKACVTSVIKNKGFKGYFLEDMYVGGGGPIGPYYGLYSPPRLVE